MQLEFNFNGLTIAGGCVLAAMLGPLFIKERGGYMGNMNQGLWVLGCLGVAAGALISWMLN